MDIPEAVARLLGEIKREPAAANGQHRIRAIKTFLPVWGKVPTSAHAGLVNDLDCVLEELSWDTTPDRTWRLDQIGRAHV